MQQYTRINNITGWVMFAFAFAVYLITMEPTASFWDCGEFISASYKLQVVHAPGAPLFLMISKIISLLSFGDESKIAWWVNAGSALASAFGVLFLFWSVTILGKKIIIKSEEECTTENTIAVMGAGVIGALACTFLDSYWFSAAEAEVYSLSSFFGAFVFWAALKWDQSVDNDKYADRWLILIAYCIGLSLGVHLLSLLVIPAVALIYYFKKVEKKMKRKNLGLLLAFVIGFMVVGFILKFILSGIPTIMSKFDLKFVNSFGMGLGSGAMFFLVLMLGAIGGLLFYSHKTSKVWLQKIVLATFFLIIGFSSYTMVIIRAKANTPINIGAPDNFFSMVSYINREQYGERPLSYGEKYNLDPSFDVKYRYGAMNYYPTQIDGKDQYVELGEKLGYSYDKDAKVFFPRIYSWQDDRHVRLYRNLLQPDFLIVDQSDDLGEEMDGQETILQRIENNDNWQAALKEAEQTAAAYMQAGNEYVSVKDDIGFKENIEYFYRYQFRYMYMRYFMWNFAGRETDVQGTFGSPDGHWISGIGFIDKMFSGSTGLSSQKNLPETQKNNPARNTFFFLPLILGIVGVYYLFIRDIRSAAVVLLLFFTTGFLQMIYLNQPPVEPRERDYTLVGSFFTFTIWIGLGMLLIYEFLKTKMNARLSVIAAFAVCLIVPALMGVKGWDDHNRSNRYTARDFATNYLESCAPNAIIFTQGDNDTYPLWYAQEVEGIRPDIRVLNLSLLGVDWYVGQIRRKINDSPPIKLTLTQDQVRGSKRDAVRYYANIAKWDQNKYFELNEVMKFVASENKKDKVQYQSGYESFLPTKKIKITVDSAKVVANNVVMESDRDKIVKEMYFDLTKSTLIKNDLIVLDIIANNLFERPIYFAVSVNPDASLGLENYFQMEGLAYRIVPVANVTCVQCETGFAFGDSANCKYKTITECLNEHGNGQQGRVQTEIMYDNVMNKFVLGNIEKPGVYLDENILRMTYNIRANYGRLADKLADEGKMDQSIEVLQRAEELMPDEKVPYNIYLYTYPETYYRAGDNEKAKACSRKLAARFVEELDYYLAMPDEEFEQYLELKNQLPDYCFLRPGQEMSSKISVIDAISSAASKYGDEEFAKEMSDLYDQYDSEIYTRMRELEGKYCPPGTNPFDQQQQSPVQPQPQPKPN